MVILAQTSIFSAEGVILLVQVLGIPTVIGLFLYLFMREVYKLEGSIREKKQDKQNIEAMIEQKVHENQTKLIDSHIENNKRLEAKLEDTQQAWQTKEEAWKSKEQAWDTERETLLGEVERSLNSESSMAKELKIVKDDLDRVTRELNTVKDTLAKIEREREIDKIEKQQILDEKKRVDIQNRDLLKEKSKLIKEKNILEKLIASQGQQIEILTSSDKRQIHEISRLQGTVNSLENALKKYTDDTQEIPDFKDIENAGDEVITPVVAMDLNIDDPEATTIIEVTAVDTPTDDNASNDDDENNLKEAS